MFTAREFNKLYRLVSTRQPLKHLVVMYEGEQYQAIYGLYKADHGLTVIKLQSGDLVFHITEESSIESVVLNKAVIRKILSSMH